MRDVLLVEDDFLVAELVDEALRESGLDVETAHSGGAALRRIEAEPRSFQVVVTDIDLGGDLNGFDVARRAREMNPDVKVVYVTGRSSNIHAAEAGAMIFPKPFDPFDLAGQLRLLLGRET